MSRNTIAFGFFNGTENVLKLLEEKGLIKVKVGITHPDGSPNFGEKSLDLLPFDLLTRHPELYDEYTKDIIIDDAVYQEVYKILPIFVDQYLRYRFERNSDYYYIINQFNIYFNFFYGLLIKDEIDLLLIPTAPHEAFSYVLYELAKVMNIQVIMLYSGNFPNKIFYYETIEDFGTFSYMEPLRDENSFSLSTYKDNLWYIPKNEAKIAHDANLRWVDAHYYIEEFKTTSHVDHYRIMLNKNQTESIPNINKNPKKTIKDRVAREIRHFKKIPSKIAKKLGLEQSAKPIPFHERYIFYTKLNALHLERVKKYIKEVDYSKKYVYFPLHVQPECTTSSLGGIYTDQILAIERVAQLIPDDWCVYVKENPNQDIRMRDDLYFTRLSHVKKATLVPFTENTHKLIENSQFVATITGTAGWEALQRGIPALTFGYAWYNCLHGAIKYSNKLKLEDITEFTFDITKFESDVNYMLNCMGTGIIDMDFTVAYPEFDADENWKNLALFLEKLILRERKQG